ncbi:MAG: hypothetical protein BroJett018_26910 [Chloroflexota bacterium]|nr:MAG: hypothetical protein BroJett018_26910 [Chloroflexota bacterium]
MGLSLFRSRLGQIVFVLVIFALAITACGDDDKKEDNTSSDSGGVSSPAPTAWKSVTTTELYSMLVPKIAAAYPDLMGTEDSEERGYINSWTLSPDGAKLFMLLNVRDADPEMNTCLYTLADEALVCRPFQSPVRLRDLPEGRVAWAPDNDHIITHYDWMIYADDPDLILLETSTGLGVVVTEDRYYGSLHNNDDESFFMDYAPFWAPDSQSIYFFRVALPVEDAWGDHLQLMNIKLDGAETTLVADLSGVIEGHTFGNPQHVAVSPDGKQVVIATSDVSQQPRPANIWRVDLTTGKAEIWVSNETITQALVPTWSEDPGFYPQDVIWTADGRYVVVAFDSQMRQAYASRLDEVPPANYLIIEAASGQTKALVDVSQFPDQATYANLGGFYQFAPLFGLLTSDSQLIYATSEQGEGDTRTTTLWSVPLTLDAEPVKLATLDLASRFLADPRSSLGDRRLGTIAANGVAFVQSARPGIPDGAYLLQFAE